MPSDTRLTPALEKSSNFPASTLVGLASRVISISLSMEKRLDNLLITVSTVVADINDGVPPPKKILLTERAPTSPA
tara:strand:+ start:15398 stop:15625 length:228 start_codon:yes stop_codon:yes gene_type:complete